MRIIITGFILFVLWSIFSNYWYVCQIRGLCVEDSGMIAVEGSPAPQSSTAEPSVQTHDASPDGDKFETVYLQFASGSDEILNQEEIYPVALKIARHLEESPEDKIVLEGHTDQNGKADANYLLGLQRAGQLKKYLIEKGIDSLAIHTISQGETQPRFPNPTREQEPLNRRVEVYIIQ